MMMAMNLTRIRGTLLIDEPMEKHTTWRVGGTVDRMYIPADIDDLSVFIAQQELSEPIMFLGLGSNLLVRDAGLRGTVIALKGCMAEVELLDASRLRAGAGISCAKLARFCFRNDLTGGEFFAGIPGLLGGALAMNAGAFTGETWKVIESVVTLDKQGCTHVRTADDYEIAYRSVKGHQDEWFVSADIKLVAGDGEKSAKQVKELLDKRNQTQPTGLPSCGSVFKNPQNDYAARLIEASDLKGFSIGGAIVSEKHANFIINTGNASAADIERLIEYVQKTVKQKQGVQLQTEVKIIGEYTNDKL